MGPTKWYKKPVRGFQRWGAYATVAVLVMVFAGISAAQVHAASPPPTPVHLPLHTAPPPGVRPSITSGAPEGYIPCDIAGAYHLDALQANGTDGAGQLIAIVDAYDNATVSTDLQQFDAAFGLPNPAFQVYNQGAASGSAPSHGGWQTEIDLDVEWAHAVAPGARIALVEARTDLSTDLFAAVGYAVNTLGAGIVSMSWLMQEAPTESTLDVDFPPQGGQGQPVSYFAASGDNGFGVGYPAASPDVIGVGGTSLSPSAVGNDTQTSHYNCNGRSTTPGVTAQNETVWGNENCTSTQCLGTGGGTSQYEPQPTWQRGDGPGSGRNTPDVAMLADPSTGVAVYVNGAWSGYMYGGTSLATPLWAGVAAMADQYRQAAGKSALNLSSQSSWIYSVAGSAFDDIVAGSSPPFGGYACTTSSCAAAPGYDLVTGRGSPLATTLIPDLVSAPSTVFSSCTSAGSQTTFGQSSQESLGGGSTNAPADVSWDGQSRQDVFIRGLDGQLWHAYSTGGAFSGWGPLGGAFQGAPAVASWGPGRLDIFVRGTDNQLWHKAWSNGWSGWEPLGGVLTSDPAAVSWGNGRIDVFARSTDNQLWHKSWSNGWSNWEPLGGVLTSAPAVTAWGPNRLDIFVGSTDGGAWHLAWSGGWSGWSSLGGALASDPAAASCATSHVAVFATATSGQLVYRAWAGGGWGPWQAVAGPPARQPGAGTHSGLVDLFTLDDQGAIVHSTLGVPAPV